MPNQVKVAVVPDAFRDFYRDGLFSDMTIVAKDGTSTPLHKIVMCAASQTLKAALMGPFKEGQTSTYTISHYETADVRLFADLTYGIAKASEHSYSDQDGSERNPRLLALARVYALADELQADSVMQICCGKSDRILHESLRVAAIDIKEPFTFVIENAGRPEQYIWAVMTNFLLPRDRMDPKPSTKLPDHTTIYEACNKIPDCRCTMIDEIIGNMSEEHPLRKCSEDDAYAAACENAHFANAILEIWMETSNLLWDDLRNNTDFIKGMQDSSLSWDCLKRQLSDNPHRPGEMHLWKCGRCGTILSTGDLDDAADIACGGSCGQVGNWQVVQRFIMDNEWTRRIAYCKTDGIWQVVKQ